MEVNERFVSSLASRGTSLLWVGPAGGGSGSGGGGAGMTAEWMDRQCVNSARAATAAWMEVWILSSVSEGGVHRARVTEHCRYKDV